MSDALSAWNKYSSAQQREVRTAVVFTSLGPALRENLTSIVSIFKRVFKEEAARLTQKSDRTTEEEKFLKVLSESEGISTDLSGLKQIEKLTDQAKNFNAKTLGSILLKCWKEAPSVLKFTGFGALLEQRALSKFVEFAKNWIYSGNNSYDPPRGISEPFSGYDAIIFALMGHPLCKQKMESEATAWERKHSKRGK